jgi:TatD DNase family protein
MIETDSPYMLPYPRQKGEKRNDSAKVRRVAECIAALRGMSVEEVARETWETGCAFFGIDRPWQEERP